ncbi:MAG: gliding motility protein GldL [Bacteroidales bacterium]|nr:gliding motility protein GldL [Bacteroidales bacterium]
MTLSELVVSPAYKKFMGYVYGFGASVAILGSLFKIMHFPGAGVMLVAGLGVEAIIFALSSFEPPHETPDWTLVYPELLGLDPEDGKGKESSHHHGGGAIQGGNGGGSELAALVSAGAIEQKTVTELSEGVKKLASTTAQMADLSDASVATKAYINNVKNASESLNQFTAIQSSVAEVGSKFANRISEEGDKLADSCTKLSGTIASQANQSDRISQNMGAVNAAYEAQLKGITAQIKSTENLASGLSSISDEINASVESVRQYRQQVANLSKTVGELNSIYGNMLSAVNK